MPIFPTVIFDLDGTLCDSRPGIFHSLHHTFDVMGITLPEGTNLNAFIGPPLHQTMSGFGLEPAQVDECVNVYRAHYAKVGVFESDPYPGIPELLHDLHAADVCLAIATTKPERFAREVIHRLGWADFFHGIFGAQWDETVSQKPKRVEDALRGAPRPAAMVGDRCFDMEAARMHRIAAIGALYGYGTAEELTQSGAERLVASVDELRAALWRGL